MRRALMSHADSGKANRILLSGSGYTGLWPGGSRDRGNFRIWAWVPRWNRGFRARTVKGTDAEIVGLS
jgi:hypothetical protein